MRIARLHTRPDSDVFDGVRLRTVTDNADYIVPQAWDDAAVDVLLQKVFCRAPLPAATSAVPETGVPQFLWRHVAEPGAPLIDHAEKDIRAVLHRMAGSWTRRAWEAGVFDDTGDARAFYDEARYLLLHRMAAPEIAIWAEAGLDWAYGLEDRKINFAQSTPPPAPASGALEHLEIEARRAALDGRTSCALLPVENADAACFIRRKADAEVLALARTLGLKALSLLLHRVMDACDRDSPEGFDPEHNLTLARAIGDARRAGLGVAAVETAVSLARQGYEDIPLPPPEDEEETQDGAVAVLSVPDAFIESALTGHSFLQAGGRHASAERLWESLAEAVWAAGEPHVFFRSSAEAASPFGDVSRSADGSLVFPPGASAPSAALDLMKLDARALEHAVTIMIVALDAMAEGPLRPVILGVANVAGFLAGMELDYDSDAGRAAAAMAVALASGAAHRASAALAEGAGAFSGDDGAEKRILQGIRDRMAVFSDAGWAAGSLPRRAAVRAALCPDRALAATAQDVFARAYVEARGGGLRNAHLSGIGTGEETQILLGAQTRGIAPLDDVPPEARLRMQAAVEPFLSGGAAQTIPLARGSSVDDVQKLILRGWELGVKSVSLYRDASSILHAAAPAEAEREAAEALERKKTQAKA